MCYAGKYFGAACNKHKPYEGDQKWKGAAA